MVGLRSVGRLSTNLAENLSQAGVPGLELGCGLGSESGSSGAPRVGAAALGSLRAPAPSAIVVGAGVAGLTAARDLKRAGWGVQVLEARSRLGGRLWTCRDDGLATELGGEFIDSEALHTHTHALAKSLGVGMVPSQMHRQVYAVADRTITEDSLDTVAPHLKAEYDRFWAQAARLAQPIQRERVTESPGAAELDQQSLADWMDTLDIDPKLRPILDRELALEYGNPRQTSLLHFALHTKLYQGSAPTEQEMYRINGGTQSLIDALAAPLAESITCDAPISAVNWHQPGISVAYHNHVVSADYLVLATPLPPLRHVSFSPALPQPVQGAIETLTYADHSKTVLFYDAPKPQEDLAYIQTHGPLGGVWQAPAGADASGGPLPPTGSARICYNLQSESVMNTQAHGDLAASYNHALAQLDQAAPVAPDRFYQQNWQDDPYAGGSYSAYGPGDVCAFWEALRVPCGPIVFAGEHTASQFTGYIEGAIESGHRAAQQLIEAAYNHDSSTPAGIGGHVLSADAAR